EWGRKLELIQRRSDPPRRGNSATEGGRKAGKRKSRKVQDSLPCTYMRCRPLASAGAGTAYAAAHPQSGDRGRVSENAREQEIINRLRRLHKSTYGIAVNGTSEGRRQR